MYNNSNQIFQFLNPNNNDLIKEMTKSNLKEFLYYLNNYNLELRKTLNIDSHITFGPELEFEYANTTNIKRELIKQYLHRYWHLTEEKTVDNGAKINSSILRDKEKTWENLEKVCHIANTNACIGRKAGTHINIGSQILGPKIEPWINCINIWSTYEDIIFRFSLGEFLEPRDTMSYYARPSASYFETLYQEIIDPNSKYYKTINSILSPLKYKNRSITFFNANSVPSKTIAPDNRIEIRFSTGTLDPIICQNYINFFVKLLKYTTNPNYNNDIINTRKTLNKENWKYYNNEAIYWPPETTFEFYIQIYLEKAIELADLIFDNNLDKIYFLRQYLKTPQGFKNQNNKYLIKSKPFTTTYNKIYT